MTSSSLSRPGNFAGATGFILAAVLAAGLASASPEVDRLAGLAEAGDRTALDALLELVRKKKDADAEYALGLMAYEGRGLARNTKQAFGLVERASSKGNAEA